MTNVDSQHNHLKGHSSSIINNIFMKQRILKGFKFNQSSINHHQSSIINSFFWSKLCQSHKSLRIFNGQFRSGILIESTRKSMRNWSKLYYAIHNYHRSLTHLFSMLASLHASWDAARNRVMSAWIWSQHSAILSADAISCALQKKTLSLQPIIRSNEQNKANTLAHADNGIYMPLTQTESSARKSSKSLMVAVVASRNRSCSIAQQPNEC